MTLKKICEAKIARGERIDVTVLYGFSKVSLRRSRMRKKFNKNYGRYVSDSIMKDYWGYCMANVVRTISCLDFNLEIEPLCDAPKGELVYLDCVYEKS